MNCVRIDGIACYGELRDDSNFSVVCDDEYYDGIWTDGNPNSKDYTFSNWEEVVSVLKNHYMDIEEITAV